MEKYYCSQFDAYFDEDKWLEGKCCQEYNDDCYYKCFERPEVPCRDCKYSEKCKDKK